MARQRKKKLVGAAVGSGIVARAAEQGGADFLFAINAGRMRIMGAPSIACMLPTHGAADLTWDFAVSEILPITDLPVYLGVNCWGRSVDRAALAERVLEAGFAGAVNFPTAMHYSDGLRRVLDQAGIGTSAEIALLKAVQDAGGKSMFFCGTRNQARAAADAGLQALVYNFGWNLGGVLGHKPRQSLEETAHEANEVSRLVKSQRDDLKLYLLGGPIAKASDLSFVARSAEIDGYVGGSTLDRVPIESSIGNQVADYRLAMDAVDPAPAPDRTLVNRASGLGLVGESAAFTDALQQIKRAALGKGHILLSVPDGGPEEAILGLLEKLSAKTEHTEFVDLRSTQANPQDLAAQVFGPSGNNRQQELLQRDQTCIILRDDASLPRAAKKGLSQLFETGAYVQPRLQLRKSPRARVILIAGAQTQRQINSHTLRVNYPTIAERVEDIAKLLRDAFARLGGDAALEARMAPAIKQRLRAHGWPGNEAEIFEIAREVLPALSTNSLTLDLIDRHLVGPTRLRGRVDLGTTPKQQLLEALARNNFRRGDTARALNISRKTLYNRMKRFELL
ncbi:MAG: phosphoenolpyruvate hydrolase family protein [Pseudomonadota bacterium]